MGHTEVYSISPTKVYNGLSSIYKAAKLKGYHFKASPALRARILNQKSFAQYIGLG